MSNVPNFFIIGAPKCGTTSLAAWLAEHPNIFISSIKEPTYFAKDINYRFIDKYDEYLALFSTAQTHHRRIGEASVFYLFSQVAIPLIEQEYDEPLYIVMLRNPVDMAYALHEQHFRRGIENERDFRDAWELIDLRRERKKVPKTCSDPVLLDYASWCLLGEQLERLYCYVPRHRVLVLLLDDIKENARQQYLRVLDFLEIPDDGRMNFPVYNSSRGWKIEAIGRLVVSLSNKVRQIKKSLRLPVSRGTGIIKFLEQWNENFNSQKHSRSVLASDFRSQLSNFFALDIRKLEKLLDKSLASWYTAPKASVTTNQLDHSEMSSEKSFYDEKNSRL
jgi:hypothetical protein